MILYYTIWFREQLRLKIDHRQDFTLSHPHHLRMMTSPLTGIPTVYLTVSSSQQQKKIKAFLSLLLCEDFTCTLLWRHNGRDVVSNHQPQECLLNRLFRRRSKKTSKLRVTGLCAGNSPVTGEFPTQRTSNAQNASIWWRNHVEHTLAGVTRQPLVTITSPVTTQSFYWLPLHWHMHVLLFS